MWSPSITLVPLLYYLTCVSSLSYPRSDLAIPMNSSVPNLLPQNLLPGFAAPLPPTDFSAHLDFNSNIQLNPVQVLLCTVEMISFLANLPWTFIIHGSMSMGGQDKSTEVFLDRWPPSGGSKFQVQYAILGLYQAGVTIAQGNKYTQLDVTIYEKGLKVGWLEFRPEDKSLLGNSSVDHLTPLTLLYAENDTAAVMADSGQIYDPADKKFVITYRMDGVRITSQDLFTVILDGFAIAAVHKNTDLNAYIPAARSASGDTVLSTWTVGGEGNPQMTWVRLKRALLIIWDLLIMGHKGLRKSRFEGFGFGLKYNGQDIGGGRMLKFDSHGQGAVE